METAKKIVVFSDDYQNYDTVLSKEKYKSENSVALKNVQNFYDKNKSFCSTAFEYKEEFLRNISKYINYITDITSEDLNKLICERKIVLVLTANRVEESIFLKFAYDSFNNCNKIDSYIVNDTSYQIIHYKDKVIIHSHAERTGDEYTRRLLNNAKKIFSPNYIILLGVCYGINIDSQSLGDVIISNMVEGYRINFRDINDGEITFEPEIEFNEKPRNGLVKRLISVFNIFQAQTDSYSDDLTIRKIPIKIEVGKMLSANCLMSSKQVKDSIVEKIGNVKPKAFGGEMEACGIFKSNFFEEGFDDWLVIKSICDWGECKNNLDENSEKNEMMKDGIQSYSMINSCQVFKTLFDQSILV